MKYIGATDAFVKTPFIIEGVIVGIVGAIIAWLITIQMYQALISNFADNSIFEFVSLNFEILKMKRVTLGVFDNNEAAHRCYKSVGFVDEKYCKDVLADNPNPDKKYAFVTYTTASEEMVNIAKSALVKTGFETIYETTAGATITSHCGEDTLGILFLNK